MFGPRPNHPLSDSGPFSSVPSPAKIQAALMSVQTATEREKFVRNRGAAGTFNLTRGRPSRVMDPGPTVTRSNAPPSHYSTPAGSESPFPIRATCTKACGSEKPSNQ